MNEKNAGVMLFIWSVCLRWQVSYVACTEVLKVEYVVKMVIEPGMSFQRKPEWFFPVFMHIDGKLHIWEAECLSCFHGTIHVCRLKCDGKLQSTCQPKHQGSGSEDHKSKLLLFPRACFFTEASTTLITTVAHWQSQKGAIISNENMKVKENIHSILCRIKP